MRRIPRTDPRPGRPMAQNPPVITQPEHCVGSTPRAPAAGFDLGRVHPDEQCLFTRSCPVCTSGVRSASLASQVPVRLRDDLKPTCPGLSDHPPRLGCAFAPGWPAQRPAGRRQGRSRRALAAFIITETGPAGGS